MIPPKPPQHIHRHVLLNGGVQCITFQHMSGTFQWFCGQSLRVHSCSPFKTTRWQPSSTSGGGNSTSMTRWPDRCHSNFALLPNCINLRSTLLERLVQAWPYKREASRRTIMTLASSWWSRYAWYPIEAMNWTFCRPNASSTGHAYRGISGSATSPREFKGGEAKETALLNEIFENNTQ